MRALSGAKLGVPSAEVSAIVVPASPAQSSGVFVAAAAPSRLALGTTLQSATAGSEVAVSATGQSPANVTNVSVQIQQAGTWKTIAALPAESSAGSWSASGTALTAQLAEGTYAVRAVAVSATGNVVATTEQSTITVVHSAPAVSGLVATAQSSSLQVSWAPAASDLSYNVYRVAAGGSALTLAATGLVSSIFVDTALVPGTSNWYVVTAVDGFGNEGPLSSPVWATTPTESPLELHVLTPAATEQPGAESILLATAAESAAGVASVEFFYAPSGGGDWMNIKPVTPGAPAPAGGNNMLSSAGATAWATTLRTTGLTAGRYDFRVIVTDRAGRSAQTTDAFFVGAGGARGPPAAGFQLSASATTAGAHLAWTGGAGSAYQVRRAVGANGTFSSLATLAGSSFDDSNLIVGLTYAYQVVELDPSVILTNLRTITATLSPPSTVTPDGVTGTTVVTASGGIATSGDGAASVIFAPGSVSSGVAISVAPQTISMPSGIFAVSPAFDLSAIDATTGALVDTFGIRPALTIHYNPAGPVPTAIYYVDPTGQAVALPSTVDRVASTITATLPHFSSYVAGMTVNVGIAAPATVDQPTTSATVTATVTDTIPEAVSAAPVNFATDFGVFAGSLTSTDSCTTSANGQCTVALTSAAAGVAHVRATVGTCPGTSCFTSNTSTVRFREPWDVTLSGTSNHSVTLQVSGSNVQIVDSIFVSTASHSRATISELSITGEAGQTNIFTVDASADPLDNPLPFRSLHRRRAQSISVH